MKSIRKVMIVWTPKSFGEFEPGTAGRVGLVPWPDHVRLSNRYTHTDGACYLAVREEFTDSELVRYTLATALALIIRDGIDPLEVHRALSELREYSENTPTDMPR